MRERSLRIRRTHSSQRSSPRKSSGVPSTKVPHRSHGRGASSVVIGSVVVGAVISVTSPASGGVGRMNAVAPSSRVLVLHRSPTLQKKAHANYGN